jgi:predicted DNA-binding transcriptional regulator YafY
LLPESGNMTAMSRAQRLLRLVQLLRRYRAPVAAATLAEELHVSVRSIYRDVTTLREQGAAIEGEAGMGYLLKPGFLLPPLMFADEELEAIILGLRLTVEHGDEALGRAAAEVVAKLRAVLPRELRALVEVTALLAGPARERPRELVELSEVRRALRRQRKAELEYVDREGAASTRIIWPLALGFFERARVVVAWCEQRKDFRSFRTDRIARWLTLDAGLPRAREALLREWREREAIPEQI